MKNKLTVIAIAALVLATLAAGSLAYYSDEVTTHNVITTGGVEIELLEWADEAKTEPFADLEGILPGATATKIVEIENVGGAEAWIRARVTPQFDAADLSLEYVDIDFNLDGWTLGEDGYYYCNSPVAPGAVTAELFGSVAFAKEMPNEYQNRTLHVDVTAQAVQTANNGATVFDAAGWPSAE